MVPSMFNIARSKSFSSPRCLRLPEPNSLPPLHPALLPPPRTFPQVLIQKRSLFARHTAHPTPKSPWRPHPTTRTQRDLCAFSLGGKVSRKLWALHCHVRGFLSRSCETSSHISLVPQPLPAPPLKRKADVDHQDSDDEAVGSLSPMHFFSVLTVHYVGVSFIQAFSFRPLSAAGALERKTPKRTFLSRVRLVFCHAAKLAAAWSGLSS